MVKCIVCERVKLCEGEGRVIDGSWERDRLIQDLTGKWVCSYKCYEKLIETHTTQAKVTQK